MSTDKNSKIKVDDEEDIESNECQESKLRTLFEREWKDISSANFWRAVFAEFLGTYMLMFWTIGMGRYNPEKEAAPDLLLIAIGTGFTVACLINALVNVSGGHVNPALSIGFLIRGDITLLKFVFCVVVQCLASACAVMTLCQLVPPEKHGDLGLLLPGPGVSSFQALIAEFWITFGLLFVTNAFIDDKRSDVTDPIPFYVGMIVAANILFTAGISGGCMNPARNFGPAVVTGQFEKQWIAMFVIKMTLFVLFFSTLIFEINAFCRGGYSPYGEYCYALLPLKASWAESLQYCKAVGGSLAVISNQNESHFIEGMISREQHNIATGQVWIGGTDLLQEGIWLAPESLEPLTYFNWAPGEPDNLGGQHCLAIFNNNNLQWDDNLCEVQNYALCKSEQIVGENIVG